MQKKIGILTFHNAVNYGAVLQAYALYHVIASAGYKVEVIDYVNDEIEKELKSKGILDKSSISSYLKSVLKKYHGYRKIQSFSHFMKRNLSLSEERNIHQDCTQQLGKKYDVLITGSDQVWNLRLTGNDMTYFLDFAADDTKRIAYAVSYGDSFNDDIGSAIGEIRKFAGVSVREPSLNKYLRDAFAIDNNVCCDPVILAGRSAFEKIKSKRLLSKKYVFCFLMGSKPGLMDVARSIAREKDFVLIDNKSSFEFFMHSSPEDFLSWIYNAEYVLTDSFHGTAFSIIFHKQFVSDKYDEKGNLKQRIFDLLTELSIENRLQAINNENADKIKSILYEPIDYDLVEKERCNIAKMSKDWLMDSIRG